MRITERNLNYEDKMFGQETPRGAETLASEEESLANVAGNP